MHPSHPSHRFSVPVAHRIVGLGLTYTHGMVSSSTIVLVLYTFWHYAGSFGISPFRQLPGPLLFLDPRFPLGILAIPVCSVANFLNALPLPPFSLDPDYLPLSHSHTRREVSRASSTVFAHMYITWAFPLIVRPSTRQSARL